MKKTAYLLAFPLILAACGTTDNENAFRGGTGGDAAYGRGLQSLERGETAAAHDYFVCAAEYGNGYEVAWYYAGTTALELASQGVEGSEDYLETGEDYLERSGEAGWGASQAALAHHFHETGAAQQAAYWALLYTNNVREISLGLTRMDADTIAEIREGVSDDVMAETELAAARFVPQPLSVGRSSAECADAIRSDRERSRQRPQRPRREETRQPGGQRQPGGGVPY
ncbi:hypothetical protein [Hyphobacterium sp.]|uniref:hypothetical protein n=1 Tax=Hyphobacterium sp. TaxID=2004662 RepID=UPI003BAA984F